MKTKTRSRVNLLALLLAGLACATLQAGDVFYDFTTTPAGGDPTGGAGHCAPCTTGFIVLGTHANAGLVWSSGAGAATNGNPSTTGYVSIGDGSVTTGQGTVIVFPDVDAGQAIQAFHLTADLRVGNAGECDGRPADGFSISYCRAGDPVLVNATNGIAHGAAGGDDCPTTVSSGGSDDYENGTKTGVAICFDAWQGNLLPDTSPEGGCGPDTEGIEIRADDHTLLQLCMQADRNGNCRFGTNGPAPCNAAACTDPNTMQTGGYATNNAGDFSTLCWQRLDVLVTNGPSAGTKLVTVTWKGTTLINNYVVTNFPNYRGRLVLMGRTGGCNQNDHVANVHLVTTVASVATYDSVIFGPGPNQFQFFLHDNGASVVTNVSLVLLDGVDVTSSVTTSKLADTTTGTATLGSFLASGSTHTVAVTYKDAVGQTLGGTGLKFTVVQYIALPASLSVPGDSINYFRPGFLIQPHQTLTGAPNRNYWADEQLEGLHGTNQIDLVDSVSNLTASGESAYDGHNSDPAIIDFSNGQSGGQFLNNFDFTFLGIPSTNVPCNCADNSALAISAYLYFPSPGFYFMGVNSDDGFRVSFAKNSHDMLGSFLPALSADTGRGIANNENIGGVYIGTPGYYGARLLWYNGGGGAGVEWYTTQSPLSGNTNYPVLINQTNDPNASAVFAYQVSSAAPPYVSFAEPPLQDDQVASTASLHYQLTDASTTVVPGSVLVKLNGASQAAHTAVNKSGAITDVFVTNSAPIPSGSNWVQIAFSDSNGTNYTDGYAFTASQQFVTLDASLATPLGSQDLGKPGFTLRVSQVDPCMPSCLFGGPNDCGDGTVNQVDSAEAMIAGTYFPWFGTNAANFSGSVNGNMWYWTGSMGFSTPGGASVDGFTLAQLPGIPTVDSCSGNRPNDSYAASFDGFAVFPSAGLYNMTIASDDGFRLTEGIGVTRQILHVSGASGGMDIAAVPSTLSSAGGNWQNVLPLVPITAPVQYVDLTGCPCGFPNLNLSGKIALIDANRCNGDGGDGNYNPLVSYCQVHGAIACIVQASPGWGTPELMNGGSDVITIPALHIIGFNGLKDWFHTNGTLTATIGGDANLKLFEADYGKGPNDINFTINVPQPGVYPLHLIYEQGGGGAALVWYTTVGGVKHLVNDSSDSSSVLVYRARTVATPTISIARVGTSTRITYTGRLLCSPDVTGTYVPVAGATSPYTVTGNASRQFYRAQNF